MLSQINIRNIALIDKLTLDFYEGLNILSGETGAGKSIIIDSLNFVLGERADRSLIRYGEKEALVEGVFTDYLTPTIHKYLDDINVDIEDVLIVSRRMTTEGRNECRINGRIATLSMLKGLTELLCDIHGQHEHQSLLRPQTHIDLLDSFEADKITRLKLNFICVFSEYKSLRSELQRLGDEYERQRKIELLSYQVDELTKANLVEGEEDALLDMRRKIRNSEKILSALNNAYDLLDGYSGTSVVSELKSATLSLSSISSFEEQVSPLIDRLEDAKVEVKDISDSVKSILSGFDFDEQTAAKTEERLELVRSMSRKYGGSVSACLQFFENAKNELSELLNCDERVENLTIEISKTEKRLLECAKALSNERKSAATTFEKRITKELKDLGMGTTEFKVEFYGDYDNNSLLNRLTDNGCDNVEFLISPNVGEPLKPLSKIISGGEMSRFMLALKNIVCTIDGIATMVFDEIDTGISGAIAQVVAMKMCNISRVRQVLAVTHMPQLASMADHHYLISKSVSDGKTHTNLTLLDDSTTEIARLVGGSEYSDTALPHAKNMKKWGDDYKLSLKH